MNNISANSRVTAVFKSDFVDTNRKRFLSLISFSVLGKETFSSVETSLNKSQEMNVSIYVILQTPRCIKEAAAEHSKIIIQVYNRFFSCKSIITVL